MKSYTKTQENRKMARNRPRFGEIGRESGQKDEESTRNPKKALPGPENGIRGVCFALFVFVGVDFFEICDILCIRCITYITYAIYVVHS